MRGSPLQLGIVGCGRVVERGYLPALRALPEIRLKAVADPSPERRQLASGASQYADLRAMLEANELDAVLVCSPSELHLEHAERCARLGLQTLVEKPPGVTVEEARRLAELRPAPRIAFNRRFAAGLPRDKGVSAGAARVTAIFDAPATDWEIAGQEPLLDLGCHLIDLVCWLTRQRPIQGRAIAVTPQRASFELEFEDGMRLYAECGEAAAYRELLEFRSDSGDAWAWEWPAGGWRGLGRRLARSPSELISSWRGQLEAFVRLVRFGEPGRLAPACECLQVMDAIEVITRSAAARGTWIQLDGDLHRSAEVVG